MRHEPFIKNTYEYQIYHRPGKLNEAADALSRNFPEVNSIEERQFPDRIKEEQEKDAGLKPLFSFFNEGITPKGRNAITVAQNFTIDRDGVLWFIKNLKLHNIEISSLQSCQAYTLYRYTENIDL